MRSPTRLVLTHVALERERQLRLKAEGRFAYTPSDPEISNALKLTMLAEEFGEVARQVLAHEGIVQETADPENLWKELVQVAAVSIAWLEGLLTTMEN